MAERPIVLSVKALVDFSARSGDLFSDARGPTAQEGQAVHRRVQAARGEQWVKELALKQSLVMDGYWVTLQGRADLVNDSTSPVVLEEVKSTYIPLSQIPANKQAMFWAQLKVYAFLYGLSHPSVTDFELRLSLAQVHINTTETLANHAAFSELEAFTKGLLTRYLSWLARVDQRREDAQVSAASLAFPYPAFRDSQRALAAQVYRTIRDKKLLVAQAPTGIGKTISTLFPAMKALGEDLVSQVVYLTAKTSGQQQAEKAIARMREHGLQVDHLTLCARDKICPCRATGSSVLMDEQGRCDLTRGFYDKLPEARLSCLRAASLNTETISGIAAEHQVCPFALSQHLLPWSTIVIGDYNYVFDPLAAASVFSEPDSKRLYLVDEAHNLPARSREMFSASLSTEDLTQIEHSAGATSKRVAARLRRQLLKLEEALPPVGDDLPTPIAELVKQLAEALAQESASAPERDLLSVPAETASEAFRRFYRFQAVLTRFSKSHKTLVDCDERKPKQARLSLLCLDASVFLSDTISKARATIAFSATLAPVEFYRDVLGMQDAQAAILDSPFPKENSLVLRCDYISTRWHQRNASTTPLAQLVAAVASQKQGKYLVFFPSYDYLNSTFAVFVKAYPEIHSIPQEAGGTNDHQSGFLRSFFASEGPVIGFAVLGGVFAEGVDYQGDALVGAIIIGTGMPQPSVQQSLMKAHFAKQGLNGYRYAYQYPGFARVQQGAGRVIRSETDKGVIILVDDRYRQPDYQILVNQQWQATGCASLAEVQLQLAQFWARGSESDGR